MPLLTFDDGRSVELPDRIGVGVGRGTEKVFFHVLTPQLTDGTLRHLWSQMGKAIQDAHTTVSGHDDRVRAIGKTVERLNSGADWAEATGGRDPHRPRRSEAVSDIPMVRLLERCKARWFDSARLAVAQAGLEPRASGRRGPLTRDWLDLFAAHVSSLRPFIRNGEWNDGAIIDWLREHKASEYEAERAAWEREQAEMVSAISADADDGSVDIAL